MAQRMTIDPQFKWDDGFPLTQGLRVGSWLFLAGQIALDADGNVVGKGDLLAQTRQVFENIKLILQKGGASLKDVVKMTTYFTADLQNKMDEYFAARREYFGDVNPPSTGVQVAALAFPGLLLEKDVIAILPSAEAK
jgi:enamine deaminase RidA (YjgF/YER057c/UK114 family)